MPVYQYRDSSNGEMVELVRSVERRDEVPRSYVRILVPERIAIAGTSSDPVDPSSAVGQVPKAFRDLEQKMPAREIVRESGFSIETVKRVWGM